MADKQLKSLDFGTGDTYRPLPIVNTIDSGKVLTVDYKGNWQVLEQRVTFETEGQIDIATIVTPHGGPILMSYNAEEDCIYFGDCNCKTWGGYLAIRSSGEIEVSASPSTGMGVVNLAYLQSKFNELSDQYMLLPPPNTSYEGNVLMVNSKGIPQWTAITNAEEVAY